MMQRRAFLKGATLAAAVTPTRAATGSSDDPALDPDEIDAELVRDLHAGRYQPLGTVPETDEVVVTVERAAADRATLMVHTIEAYTTPEAGPALRVPVRCVSIHLLGPTPYRIELLPWCEIEPPSSAAFIRFATAVSLAVYVRHYRAVDSVVLMETSIPTARSDARG